MNVLIGVPTIGSYSYIINTLERILEEILFCPKEWKIYIVVCVNGGDVGHRIEGKIRELFKRSEDINGYILIEEQAGKNNAMNKIVAFARELDGIDIVHFFDDDIHLEKKSFLTNIETLIIHERKNRKAALVGSAFIGIERPLSFFLDRYPFFEAVSKWIFHIIIIQPYLLDAERPKFCEGPSFCSYLKYFPSLPDDVIGVTDDAFLSNFFAIKGKEDYVKTGDLSIIKPKNSVSFMKMPVCFSEWKKQQIRIHAGVERAFSYFGSERIFLEEYFSWSYAFNRNSRTHIRTKSLFKMVAYLIYMFLHERNRREAEKLVIRKEIPDWSVAQSTK